MYKNLYPWIYYKQDSTYYKVYVKGISYKEEESYNTRYKFTKTLSFYTFVDIPYSKLYFQNQDGIYLLSDFYSENSYTITKDGKQYSCKVLDNVEATLTSIDSSVVVEEPCQYIDNTLYIDDIEYKLLDYKITYEKGYITYTVTTDKSFKLVPEKEYHILLCNQYTFKGQLSYILEDTDYSTTFTTKVNSEVLLHSSTTKYQWIVDGYLCKDFDKYQRLKEQYKTTGDWQDTGRYKQGIFLKTNSEDCGYVIEPIYEWMPDSRQICENGNLYNSYALWVDFGDGYTKTNRYKVRDLLETDSSSCGVTWEEVTDKYYCEQYYAPTKIQFTNNQWSIPFIGASLKVDWGDGTTETYTVSPAYHKYDTTDTYTVSFEGNIVEWTLRFQECKILQFGTDGIFNGDGSGLTYIGPSYGAFKTTQVFPQMTLTALTTVDSKFLQEAILLNSMDYAFKGSQLTAPISIPSSVQSVVGMYESTKITDASNAFINSNVLDATDVFKNTTLANLSNCFSGSKVTTLPNILVAGDANLSNAFSSSNIESIDITTLDEPTLNMESAFFLCQNLKSIPTINGNYPWTYSGITKYTGCFKGINTDVPNYNEIPDTWK